MERPCGSAAGGQEGLELAGGEEIGTADRITYGGVGSNRATGEAVVGIGRSGELPDVGAKMSWGFAEARVWRSGVATVVQCTGYGGAEQGSGAGVLGGGCGGVVRTGVSRGQLKTSRHPGHAFPGREHGENRGR